MSKAHLEPALLQVETLLAELRGSSPEPGPDLVASVIGSPASRASLQSRTSMAC